MKNLRTEREIMQNWKGDLSQPLVSVCCITYNHEPYIEDALEGFLTQETDFPFEILIHDDASTDMTADIIREYEAAYPNLIRPIYQVENQYSKGNKPGLNILQRARGKYIALCEGDDYWIDTEKMQKQAEFLETHLEYGLVHADGHFYYVKNGKTIKNYIRQGRRNPNLVDDPYEAILRSEYPVLTCSTMFRKSLSDQIAHDSFPRFKMGDTLLWLELAQRGKIYFFDEAMVARHILIESAAHSKSYEKLLVFKISGYDLCQYFMDKYETTDKTKQIVHEKFNRVILNYAFRAKNTEAAKKSFQRLIRNNPQSVTFTDKLHYLGSRHLLLRYVAMLALFKLKIWKKLNRTKTFSS